MRRDPSCRRAEGSLARLQVVYRRQLPDVAYVKDPGKIAKLGDVVRVEVFDVDPKRRRISLTMRLDQRPVPAAEPKWLFSVRVKRPSPG
jgi:transcriptional accessory protein Tex/SPT6